MGSGPLSFDPDGVVRVSQRIKSFKQDLVVSFGRGISVSGTGATADADLDQAIASFGSGWRDGAEQLETHIDNITQQLDMAVQDHLAFDQAIAARFGG